MRLIKRVMPETHLILGGVLIVLVLLITLGLILMAQILMAQIHHPIGMV